MGENENRPVVAQNRPIGRNPPSFPSLQATSQVLQTDLTVAATCKGRIPSATSQAIFGQMEKYNHAEILFTSPEFTRAR
jgi:hypothetical protein